MAAIIVGTYDASTFVEGNFSTYPALPAGVEFYQLGMAWEITVAGTVLGQPALPGDLLFTLEKPRRYGNFTYGDKVYGSHHPDAPDWLVDEITFQVWSGQGEAPDLGPYPNAGCPFTPAHGAGGEWAPGWRIVVNAYYDKLPRPHVRSPERTATWSTAAPPSPAPARSGSTSPSPRSTSRVGDGMAEGGPRVSVSEVVVQFVDPVGRWFDIATPAAWIQPKPGTPLRVGLLDPTYRYHALITGQIERIEDVHDGAGVRKVSVRGFGQIMDLVVDLPQVTRPTELATARFNYYLAAAGWRWDTTPIAFPSTGNGNVLREGPADVQAREQMDRTCSAVGWFMDSTRQGRVRVREWPHLPTGTPLQVVDCHGHDALVSHSMVFANDESQLLNYVITTSTEDATYDPPTPAKSVTAEDQHSNGGVR